MPHTIAHTTSTGIDACALKIAAIVCMTIQHAAYVFGAAWPLPALCICYFFGGFTFLIMAFLLTEGYRYTRDVKKYALRLLVFALVSEIPYWLVLEHNGNVLFTLLIGLVILYANDHVENRAAFAGILVAGVALSALCDWGIIGPIAIYVFKICREDERRGAIAIAPLIVAIAGAAGAAETILESGTAAGLPALFYAVGNLASAVPLAVYNGQRGRGLKYFFYLYYPLHIAMIGLIACV